MLVFFSFFLSDAARPAAGKLTDKVVDPVAHHVGGLGGAVEPEVFGHSLLLLGRLTHLLQGNVRTHSQ